MQEYDFMEKVALELGFVGDNYYTAKEQMFRSCITTVGGKG